MEFRHSWNFLVCGSAFFPLGFRHSSDDGVGISVPFLDHHHELLVKLQDLFSGDDEFTQDVGHLYVVPALEKSIQETGEAHLIKALIPFAELFYAELDE
jgi:hypothetical protein